MSLPEQLAAYNDCFDVFDKAMADPTGIRCVFDKYERAKFFQLRMNQARSLMRKESTRLYPQNDPRHNKSEYDSLVVRNPVEDEAHEWWVYIERHGSVILGIESLSTGEPLGLDPPKTLRLTYSEIDDEVATNRDRA